MTTSSPFSRFGNPLGSSLTFQQYLDQITSTVATGTAAVNASQTAAATSASAAASSQTAAASSASAASGSASGAASSASAAAGSATAAAGSASTASAAQTAVATNATTASTAATTATTQAGNASTSATAAAASALAALNSQSAVQSGVQEFKNRIINPSFQVDQWRSGQPFTATPSGYCADRWIVYGQGRITTQTVSPSTFGTTNNRTASMLVLTNGASGAAPGASDVHGFGQRIEANQLVDFGFGTAGAYSIGLTFSVRSSVTQSFSVSIRNNGQAGGRTYLSSYSLVANTDTTVSLVIPGDVLGTWATDATCGFDLFFDLGCGANFASPTAGSWIAGSWVRLTATPAWVANANATFRISAVQLERLPVGATTTTPFSNRPLAVEIAACQRYYETGTNYLAGYSLAGANAVTSTAAFKVTKRTAPTCTTTLSSAGNCTAVIAGSVSADNVEIARTITSTGSFFGHATWTANAELP